MYRFSLLFFLFLVIAPVSCGTGAAPRQEIEEFIAQIEAHFEARRGAKLRHYISPDYRDTHNTTRKELLRIAAGYILRHPSIHIVWKMRSLSLKPSNAPSNTPSNTGQSNAEVTIVVAVSPTPLTEDDIRLAQAEFHRLHLRLVKEKGWLDDDWLVQNLAWQRIDFEEFMIEGG